MCGIAGIFTVQGLAAFEPHVASIVRSQHNRGPDFNAVVSIPGTRARAVLGHNRLSIIDLSPAGNQPMWDIDRRLCLVFNGEIYNYVELRAELVALGHRFLSTSDTEVILESFKRWGIEAFGRFNGMFAFALFDTHDERLYLVRDRFGVKPLYYVLRNDTIHFASTGYVIAKLLNLSPNLDYVSCGIRYFLYEHDDLAPYNGMKALVPSHWLEVYPEDTGRLTSSLKPYYDLNVRTAVLTDSMATISIESAVDSVAELLDDAVSIRLRSDVPVAVSLSGGLDSTTVAALAARYPQERLHAFTFGDPQVAHSEGTLAAQFAKLANIDVTFIWPSVNDICAAFPESLHAQVGPVPGGSIVAQYMVFKAARTAGFKVLLGGQGGDEAFLGYFKFQYFQFRKLLAQRHYLAALGFGLNLLPTFFAERWRWLESWKTRYRYLREQGMTTVLRLPQRHMEIGYSTTDDLRNRQIQDVTMASLPTLLRYEDSNSMGNSIESRLPFLDYRAMELGIALPASLKLRGGYGKWIIRRAMVNEIPNTIRNARYKRAFDVKENYWIDKGLGDCIRKMLHERSQQVSDWLPPGAEIDKVFSNEQLKNRSCAIAESASLLWLASVTNHSS